VRAQHQAQGLQRMFSGRAVHLLSVLAGPSAPASDEFVLALAGGLSRHGQPVWLVETDAGRISERLGCRPLLPWRASQPLQQQVIRAGVYGLIHAPGIPAGDAALANAALESGGCNHLLFDGGRFSQAEAQLDPATAQTLVVLLGKQDAEAGYALIKALEATGSRARVLLLGEVAERVAQTARRFLHRVVESCQTGAGVCQIGNRRTETSSNTLTIEPNLTWVVSRIMQNDQPKVAYGGCGNSAEEVYER
jgi:hypothetical protein